MGFEVVRLDHVQLAMPPGREAEAEAFYSGLLGLTRRPKPEPMASRGGCWFEAGAVAVHLGVEAALRAAGVEVRPNPDATAGHGAYVDDPFGNRIELIAQD
jgi:catechol 2,3-dioxygenase-like lactoylglutathione lyase family enzyme